MDLFPGLVSAAAALSLTLASVQAETVQIGTSHFSTGATVNTASFLGAVTGQPAPFDDIYGSDASGTDFSASWTFSFTPSAEPIAAAELSVGLWDGDFAGAGSQISAFTVDGVDILTLANAVFEAGPGTNNTYSLGVITLPPAVFTNLQDGSATVMLTLQGPGIGVLPAPTPSNGAGVDFAQLTVTAVPEPSAGVMLGVLAVTCGGMIRRRRTALRI